jgi:Tol biopolymer transport system component
VPAELEKLVRRCLRKDPARRWQSMADLRVVLEELLEGDLSQEVVAPLPAHSRRFSRDVLLLAGILLAGAIGFVLAMLREIAPPSSGPELVRLTEDPGVSIQPSLSPDGKLVAFTSDRAGEHNLDIWVMQTSGGQPVRITADPANDLSPSFSPDSTRLVFRSDREGGGIYSVAALGGDARLLAPAGHYPRFSPDGKWIAYIWGAASGQQNKRTLNVIPAGGGPPREIPTQVFANDVLLWTSDSRALLVPGYNSAERTTRLWRVSIDSGTATAFDGSLDSRITSPFALLDNYLYFVKGLDLWRIRAYEVRGVHGALERLTAGTAVAMEPSAAVMSDGTVTVAFSSGEADTDIWLLPADTARGKVTAPPRRLASTLTFEVQPHVSKNESKLAFLRSGRVWIKDLKSGKETEGPAVDYSATLNFDGSRLAMSRSRSLVKVSPPTFTESKVRDGRARATDWSRDGRFCWGQLSAPPQTQTQERCS